MSDIQKTLRDEVLQAEKKQSTEHEDAQTLDSLKAALSETTSVRADSIDAIAEDLRGEAIKNKKKPTIADYINLPKISALKIRIAGYVLGGFLAYSFYQSQGIKEDLYLNYDDSVRETQFDFYQHVNMTKMLIGDSYSRFYSQNQRFPVSLIELDLDSQTTNFLNAKSEIVGFEFTKHGVLRFNLSDTYGYNRWVEYSAVEPETHLHGSSLACRSNVQRHLLDLHGSLLCDHIANGDLVFAE